MKELRPLHTLLLTLSTVVILLAVSAIPMPNDAVLGIRSIDMFSALRPSTEAFPSMASSEECQGNEDYSVDYVRNDIINNSDSKDQQPRKSDTAATDSTTKRNKSTTTNFDTTTRSAFKTPQPLTADNTTNTATTTTTPSQTTTTPTVEPQKLEGEGGIGIENRAALAPFFERLRSDNVGGRPVRIAVLGDSFIEGDIFTQDLRELFQDQFGGSGVGYVPMASNVAGFRQTITHTYAGWTTHCISTAARRGNYTISSYTFTPGDGSVSRYATTTKRRHIGTFSRARLMFINRGNTTINARINDDNAQQFTPASSERMQQITLAGDSICSVELSFRSTDGFTAYGVYFDGVSGVAVDNYSVRGNSGVSLVSTSMDLLTQMNSLMPIDLIILEYGLNVTQADVRNYSQYQAQMQKALLHLRKAFPNASILLMSVPDRAHRTAVGWQTMPGIKAMEKMQRQLAADCGVAFWSTMKNMQSIGGMGYFVGKGWAAKDYTHLSHKGGRVVARSLYDALIDEYDK